MRKSQQRPQSPNLEHAYQTLLEAVRSNDPRRVDAELPADADAELIRKLVEKADSTIMRKLASCHDRLQEGNTFDVS